ncbi:MAG: helix-hairpin-helix domain-containing protein [Deltaproteobacteria bacterium]|nr:helix-hairpin-helix domain-containing protein [Deltaproteobacteria bacterium]
MPFRSRLGVVLLGWVILVHAAVSDIRPQTSAAPCLHPFGVRDWRHDQPVVFCGGEARIKARALLVRMGHPCEGRILEDSWLESGQVIQLGRDCALVRGWICATRRLALGQRLEINSASSESLQALPRIGPALAGRIVRFRQERGLFGSVEELREVHGIGTHTMARLRPYVRCGRQPPTAPRLKVPGDGGRGGGSHGGADPGAVER